MTSSLPCAARWSRRLLLRYATAYLQLGRAMANVQRPTDAEQRVFERAAQARVDIAFLLLSLTFLLNQRLSYPDAEITAWAPWRQNLAAAKETVGELAQATPGLAAQTSALITRMQSVIWEDPDAALRQPLPRLAKARNTPRGSRVLDDSGVEVSS